MGFMRASFRLALMLLCVVAEPALASPFLGDHPYPPSFWSPGDLAPYGTDYWIPDKKIYRRSEAGWSLPRRVLPANPRQVQKIYGDEGVPLQENPWPDRASWTNERSEAVPQVFSIQPYLGDIESAYSHPLLRVNLGRSEASVFPSTSFIEIEALRVHAREFARVRVSE